MSVTKPKRTMTKRQPPRGIATYTDRNEPPPCNRFCYRRWSKAKGHWVRSLNKAGRDFLSRWYDKYDGKLEGMLKRVQPGVYGRLVPNFYTRRQLSEALWPFVVQAVTRWEEDRCGFKTLVGWAVQSGGTTLLRDVDKKRVPTVRLDYREFGAANPEKIIVRIAEAKEIERERREGLQWEGESLLKAVKAVLSERELKVVEWSLMREDKLREIGARLGVSKERVRQIRDAAVEKIQARVHRHTFEVLSA